MSDTPRTDVAEHNMGSIVEPHYVVDIDFAQQLERELADAREQLRLCNVDQWTTAAELAEATELIVREWVGLTGEEIEDINKDQTLWEIIRAAEDKLRKKNT